jgi:hypothetical protein
VYVTPWPQHHSLALRHLLSRPPRHAGPCHQRPRRRPSCRVAVRLAVDEIPSQFGTSFSPRGISTFYLQMAGKAERVGFEPTRRLNTAYAISNRAPSANSDTSPGRRTGVYQKGQLLLQLSAALGRVAGVYPVLLAALVLEGVLVTHGRQLTDDPRRGVSAVV